MFNREGILVLEEMMGLGVHIDVGGKVGEGRAEGHCANQQLNHEPGLVLVMHLHKPNHSKWLTSIQFVSILTQ